MFRDEQNRKSAAQRLGLSGTASPDQIIARELELMRAEVLTKMGLPVKASPAEVIERAEEMNNWDWYQDQMEVYGCVSTDTAQLVRLYGRSRWFAEYV